MQGYKLNEGLFENRKLSSDEIWETFNWLFSSYSRNDASYKFIFLKSIIDCLDYKDFKGRITFDTLFSEFTQLSWNLVLKYDISQKGESKDGRVSTLERILKSKYTVKDSFDDLFEQDKKKICHEIKQECKKYVVGALYGDTKGCFYSFSKKEEWILINPLIEGFIRENQALIENLNYFKWAKFYEVVNSEEKTKMLCERLKSGYIRKNESVYRTILAYEFETSNNTYKRVNTIELLLDADRVEESISIKNEDVEEELYRDFSHLRKYLDDPIMLVRQLQREKGITV